MMESTIKDMIMKIVSADLDGQPFQTQILSCLQMLREKEGEMSTFADSVCFDSVDACRSTGGQERIQFILLNALIIESKNLLQSGESIEKPTVAMDNLTKCLCLLNLKSSLESGGDDMNQRALTFLGNPIAENQQIGTALVQSLLSTARLPNTIANYGLYIPALILAVNIFAMAPPPVDENEKIWNSDHEDPRTAFRRDVVDLFGRRLFALGGSAKPASAVHVDLAKSIVVTLTKEEFSGSIVGPMKFKLMSAPHDAMETLGSFINTLAEVKKGEFLLPHLSTGANLISASLKQLMNSEETKVRDDASFVLATLVKACPIEATKYVSESLIHSLSTNNIQNDVNSNVTIGRILIGFERLAQTLLNLKDEWEDEENEIFWENPANDVISALENVERTDINAALSTWHSLVGKKTEDDDNNKSSATGFFPDLLGVFNHSRPSSDPQPDLTQKSTLDQDLNAKRAAASSSPAVRPGAQNINDNVSALDRRIAAKTNSVVVSDIESQIAAKSRAKAALNDRLPQNGSGNIISDLDQRISRKTMSTQGAPSVNQNKLAIAGQESNTQPSLEVKEISLDDMCSSEDVEEYSLIKHNKESQDGMDATQTSSDEETADLAVAVAVDPEDDPFLPAAMEYDPDAKPKIYKSKRFKFATLVSILILISISVGVGVSMSKNISDNQEKPVIQQDEYVTKSPTNSPTFAPTTTEQGEVKMVSEKMVNRLFGKLNEIANSDYKSGTDYHSLSLKWLIHADPTILDYIRSVGENGLYTENHFLRRIVMTILYFSLATDRKAMTSCKPYEENMILDSTGENKTHCIYDDHILSGKMHSQTIRARWLSEADVCDWGGIYCCDDLYIGSNFDGKRSICGINFRSQELNGKIPEEIGLLTELRTLNLSNNSLVGEIPAGVGQLMTIEVFEVQANQLKGPMPIEIYNNKNLKQLNVVGNTLTGQLHSNISELALLSGLNLFGNLFSGIIPTEIGSLKNLNYLNLGNNLFTGSIPSELGKLKLLSDLNIRGCSKLTGNMPSEIGNIRKLVSFDMAKCGISGTLPENFYNLKRLRKFYADSNQLSGSISTQIGNLTSLEFFSLRQNQMNGTIPIEVGMLSNLKGIALHRNNFVGNISDPICSLFNDGKLKQLISDCMDSFTETGEVQCDCCTTCCQPGVQGSCFAI